MNPTVVTIITWVLGVPAAILAGMKVQQALVRVRVTVHRGYIFRQPPWHVFPLEEIMARGANPLEIHVTRRETPPSPVLASASAPENIPAGQPRLEAWFIRIWNHSAQRAITITEIRIESGSGRWSLRVPGGQVTLNTGRKWETWLAIRDLPEQIRATDLGTSVLVKVLQRGRPVRSVPALPEEIAPAGEIAVEP